MDEDTLRSRLEKVAPPAALSRFFVPPARPPSRYLQAVRRYVVFWLVALIAGALIGVVAFALVIAAWGGFLYRALADVAARRVGLALALLFICVLVPTAGVLGGWLLGDPEVGLFAAISMVLGWIISGYIFVRDLRLGLREELRSRQRSNWMGALLYKIVLIMSAGVGFYAIFYGMVLLWIQIDTFRKHEFWPPITVEQVWEYFLTKGWSVPLPRSANLAYQTIIDWWFSTSGVLACLLLGVFSYIVFFWTLARERKARSERR
jgi:hypothetical protein